jgi:hypothetical protein
VKCVSGDAGCDDDCSGVKRSEACFDRGGTYVLAQG